MMSNTSIPRAVASDDRILLIRIIFYYTQTRLFGSVSACYNIIMVVVDLLSRRTRRSILPLRTTRLEIRTSENMGIMGYNILQLSRISCAELCSYSYFFRPSKNRVLRVRIFGYIQTEVVYI